jgi:hypothetical protein
MHVQRLVYVPYGGRLIAKIRRAWRADLGGHGETKFTVLNKRAAFEAAERRWRRGLVRTVATKFTVFEIEWAFRGRWGGREASQTGVFGTKFTVFNGVWILRATGERGAKWIRSFVSRCGGSALVGVQCMGEDGSEILNLEFEIRGGPRERRAQAGSYPRKGGWTERNPWRASFALVY